MEKVKNPRGKVFNRVKEFLHPTNVTWKSPKDTTHDSMVVLGVVAAAGILLAGFDVLLGVVLGLVI